jgi:aldehyde:ferredoxin oxidoreductase
MIIPDGHVYNVIDSLIVCKFSRGTYYDGNKDLANYYTLATGIPMTAEELDKAGERIENLAKLFNVREGKGTREYDTLPWKIKNTPVPDEGPAKGVCVSDEELQLGLSEYYAARGWDNNGVPTVEKLESLGLGEYAYIVKDLLKEDMEKDAAKVAVKGGTA